MLLWISSPLSSSLLFYTAGADLSPECDGHIFWVSFNWDPHSVHCLLCTFRWSVSCHCNLQSLCALSILSFLFLFFFVCVCVMRDHLLLQFPWTRTTKFNTHLKQYLATLGQGGATRDWNPEPFYSATSPSLFKNVLLWGKILLSCHITQVGLKLVIFLFSLGLQDCMIVLCSIKRKKWFA